MALCLAAAITVQQLTPGQAETTEVLVTSKDLPAGHQLTALDIKTVSVDPRVVPAGILSVMSLKSLQGSYISGPMRQGEIITDAALLGDELLVGAPPGTQAVPLRLSDPSTLQLLKQGQRVNVVLTTTLGAEQQDKSQVIATSVPILWTPGGAADQPGGLFQGQDAQGLVVVAAAPAQAAELAGASARGKVFLVLVSDKR